MICSRRRKKSPPTGQAAIRRVEAKQPAVDRIVYTMSRRLEVNHLAQSLEELMRAR